MLVHDGGSGILGTSHLKERDFSYFGKSDSPRRSFLLWIRYWQVSPNLSSKLATLHFAPRKRQALAVVGR